MLMDKMSKNFSRSHFKGGILHERLSRFGLTKGLSPDLDLKL